MARAFSPNALMTALGITVPIIQAPMAGANGSALVVAVSEAGGLGSLPCATISIADMRRELEVIIQQTARPYNVNFFCHAAPVLDAVRETAWRTRLAPHFQCLGVDETTIPTGSARAPFTAEHFDVLKAFRPRVVSFHFGLPDQAFVTGIQAWGGLVLSSATTVAEAKWLEAHGVDAVIAQGAEAGGHRGIFLSNDVLSDISQQPGTIALVPQIVDAVRVPVIAAGGIADGRGVAAALMLGASVVQVGTAYLLTPEAKTSTLHRTALATAADNGTALTNLFTGRPARGLMNGMMRDLGPINAIAPEFPLAANAMGALKAKAEAIGIDAYSSLWAGQAAALARDRPAADLTRALVQDALACMAEAHARFGLASGAI